MREFTDNFNSLNSGENSANEPLYTSYADTPNESRESGLTPVPQIKEIKFFTDPKAVKKKTEGSIIAFQLIFTALFCVICKITQLFTPELYLNISTYLERLFSW